MGYNPPQQGVAAMPMGNAYQMGIYSPMGNPYQGGYPYS